MRAMPVVTAGPLAGEPRPLRPSTGSGRPERVEGRGTRPTIEGDGSIALRGAMAADAPAIHALLVEHLAEGHLLPRELDEMALHAHRFVVATRDGVVVACAELAPLSRSVSEVRSLVVTRDARGFGVGTSIIDELIQRATAAGFDKLCAFTHAPSYFVHLGFSIVPHVWVPEKIVTDCHACPQFRRCGQYAVVRALARQPHAFVPLTSLHG